jgi:hypothetical protein
MTPMAEKWYQYKSSVRPQRCIRSLTNDRVHGGGNPADLGELVSWVWSSSITLHGGNSDNIGEERRNPSPLLFT